jgi:chromosome segregation ATPase
MSIEDPYFVVRDEVSSAVSSCETKLGEWRNLMEAQMPSGSRARELTSELRSNVRSAEWDLEDLEESVSVVKNNPQRFGLDLGELDLRATFIRDSRLKLQSMKNEIEGPHVNERLLAMESMPKPNTSFGRSSRFQNNSYENPSYGRFSQQQQQLMREQDGELDQIGKNVGQLKQISRAIGNELDDQAILIENLSAEVDSAHGRMNATLAKIQRVTRRIRLSTDRRQWYAIGGLAFLIFILLLILFI